MNTQNHNAKNLAQTTWVGVCAVVPEQGSFQDRRGLRGGFGFVAFRSGTLDEGVRALAEELSEGGTKLVGFEWVNRLQDNDRDLTEHDEALVAKLDQYPVQFAEIHWFTQEDE